MRMFLPALMVTALFASASSQERPRVIIPEFEPGARRWAERMTAKLSVIELDAKLKKQYRTLAASEKVLEIVDRDVTWMPYIIDGLLSDTESVARSSFQALHRVCRKRSISSSEEGFRNPIKLENFNSSYFRGGEYVFWSEQWWGKKNVRKVVAGWGREPRVVITLDGGAHLRDWDRLMRDLRAGGAYDDVSRPEGRAFAAVKKLGPSAYPRLIMFIVNEDPLMGRAAVAVLNELTGRQCPLPNETTQVTIKSQWESWCKRQYPDGGPPSSLPGYSGEVVSLRRLLPLMLCERDPEEVREFIRQLSHDSFERREQAETEIRSCVALHGALLRKALKHEKQPEARLRLMNVLIGAEILEAAAGKVRGDPEILRRFLKDLPEGPGPRRELREQIKRLLKKLGASPQRE